MTSRNHHLVNLKAPPFRKGRTIFFPLWLACFIIVSLFYVLPVKAQQHTDTYSEQVTSETDTCKWNLAITTNAVYDVLLAPSLALQVPIGKHFSVGADGYVAWIHRRASDFWHETYGFDIFGRYWFRPKDGMRLTGWYAGLYGGALTYDFYHDNKGYQSPKMWQNFRTGVEGGYVMFLSQRNRRWRLGFNVGLGILHTKQKVYKSYSKGHYYFSYERYRNLPDFTRFGVTITYMLGTKDR